MVDYPFCDSDWLAIEHGIGGTDAELAAGSIIRSAGLRSGPRWNREPAEWPASGPTAPLTMSRG
jgi:hypothetical protein